MVPSNEKSEQGLPLIVAQELKRLIYSGEILPGDRLNEAALALQMGTSRGPIREAIRILTGLGLVTAVQNRGVFVRQISVREMIEIYELRAMILGFAAERTSENLDAVHRQQFELLLSHMDAACEAGDGTRYYELNLQFHALILKVAGNQLAHQAYDDHVKELHLFRRQYFNAPGNMRQSNAQHRAIYEAIAKGAGSRARSLAERHVLSGRDRLLTKLDKVAEPP
jgi:DNA-binding GntR family transcriptional regulator